MTRSGLEPAQKEVTITMNNKRILIVDDDPVILTALSIKLKGHGYEAMTAVDGASAVSSVRNAKPDLIILDITFPPDVAHGGGVSWDGFLIMSWLKRMDEGKNVPFIIITGGDAAKYEKRALAAGATHFFHKPIQNDELLSVIAKALEEHPISAPVSA
jgi:CheY-like chemotaxis protein